MKTKITLLITLLFYMLFMEKAYAQKTYCGYVYADTNFEIFADTLETSRNYTETFKQDYKKHFGKEYKFSTMKGVQIYLHTDTITSSKNRFKKVAKSNKNGFFTFTLAAKDTNRYKYIEYHKETYSEKYQTFARLPTNNKDTIKGYVQNVTVVVVGKPAIYLYPETATEISVKLDFKGKIRSTYPKYENEWQVKAQPNGNLFNLKDQRQYEYLFWDGELNLPAEQVNWREGWIVKKEETIHFLQEKLTEIGLNNKEVNDFVVYWLPQLEQNPFNFIRFCVNDNYHNISFLQVLPKPDTEIRVMMEFLPLQDAKSLTPLPQKTLPIVRKGFTLVEWGGVQLINKKMKKIE